MDPPRSPPSLPPTQPMTRTRDPAPFQSRALPTSWLCAGAPGFFVFFFNPFNLLSPPLDRQLALPDSPCSCAIQKPALHTLPRKRLGLNACVLGILTAPSTSDVVRTLGVEKTTPRRRWPRQGRMRLSRRPTSALTVDEASGSQTRCAARFLVAVSALHVPEGLPSVGDFLSRSCGRVTSASASLNLTPRVDCGFLKPDLSTILFKPRLVLVPMALTEAFPF